MCIIMSVMLMVRISTRYYIFWMFISFHRLSMSRKSFKFNLSKQGDFFHACCRKLQGRAHGNGVTCHRIFFVGENFVVFHFLVQGSGLVLSLSVPGH